MSYYLSVRSKGQILFEIWNREGGVSLTQAWVAALPAILKCERLDGANQLLLRIDDEPVLSR